MDFVDSELTGCRRVTVSFQIRACQAFITQDEHSWVVAAQQNRSAVCCAHGRCTRRIDCQFAADSTRAGLYSQRWDCQQEKW